MRGKRKFILLLIFLFGFKKMEHREVSLYGEFIARVSQNIFLTSEGYLLKINDKRVLDSLNKKHLPQILTKDSKPDSTKRNSLLYPSAELLKKIKKLNHVLYSEINFIEPENLRIQLKNGKVIYFGLGRFEKKIIFLSRVMDRKDSINLELLSFLEGGN